MFKGVVFLIIFFLFIPSLSFSVKRKNQNFNFHPTVDDPYQETKLLIFVSSSMPESVIKSYVNRVEGIERETVFVLRGLINDSIQETLTWVKNLLCSNDLNSCKNISFDINPKLFELFSVTEVPTTILIETGNVNSCLETTEGIVYKFIGDADLIYVLDQFIKKDSQVAKTLLNKVKCIYQECGKQEMLFP